jgi:hypothetical protein
MTEAAKVPCPRCGQDWLQNARFVRLGQLAVLCPECEALWVDVVPAADNFEDYGTFMHGHGIAEPDVPSEIELLGPVQGSRRTPG